jgi:hypothetical protein
VEKHITKDLAELVEYTKITMPFVDKMRGAGFLASSEYHDLEAIKDEKDRSRKFINHILPQKGYSAFEFVIKALNDTGSNVIASKYRQILNDIKADIEQKG